MSLDEIIQKPENLSGTREFIQKLKQKEFVNIETTDKILLIDGKDLSENVIIENGFKKPIMIKNKIGLNMKVPSDHFDYADVCSKLGPNYVLDVIDTRQQIVEKMNFRNFLNYFQESPRSRTLNVLSLELSRTNISHLVEPPHIVSRLSVAQKLWPYESEKYFKKPMVEKYCLMTMKDAWTDFHIDFGGSSVWYHVLKGSKVFYVIPPRRKYIKGYCKWMKCPINRTKFFPDQVKNSDGSECEIYKLKVNCGNTILLPAGWVHAVHTPEDSLVFGGNFIHLYSVNMQIKVYKIERTLKTEEKFLFPFFQKLHWFIAYYLMNVLQYAHSHSMQPHKSYLKAAVVLLTVLPKWLADCLEMTESARADLLPVKGDFELTKLDMLEQLSDIVEKIMSERTETANSSPRSSICASESSTRSSSIHSQRNMGPTSVREGKHLSERPDNRLSKIQSLFPESSSQNHEISYNKSVSEYNSESSNKDSKKEIPCYPTSFQVHHEASSSSGSSNLSDINNKHLKTSKHNNDSSVKSLEKTEKSSSCQFHKITMGAQGNLNVDSKIKSRSNENLFLNHKTIFHKSTSKEFKNVSKNLQGTPQSQVGSFQTNKNIDKETHKSLSKNNSGSIQNIKKTHPVLSSFRTHCKTSSASLSSNLFGTNNKPIEKSYPKHSSVKSIGKRERSRSPISTKELTGKSRSPPKLEKQINESEKSLQSPVNVRKTINFLKSQSKDGTNCDSKPIGSINKAFLNQQKGYLQKIENVNTEMKLPPKLKPCHNDKSMPKEPIEPSDNKPHQTPLNSPPKLKPITQTNPLNTNSKYPKTYAEYKALKSKQPHKLNQISSSTNLLPPTLEQITEFKPSQKNPSSQPRPQSSINEPFSGSHYKHKHDKQTYQQDKTPDPQYRNYQEQSDSNTNKKQPLNLDITKSSELSVIPNHVDVAQTHQYSISPPIPQNRSLESPSSSTSSPTKKVHNPFLKKPKPITPTVTSTPLTTSTSSNDNKYSPIKCNTSNIKPNPYLKRKSIPSSSSSSISPIGNRTVPSRYNNLTPSKPIISSTNPESPNKQDSYSNYTVPRSQTIHNYQPVLSKSEHQN